ncbi:hypothetical protein ACFLZ2_04185 [Candidatus Margulisiibacteriota bacterium]
MNTWVGFYDNTTGETVNGQGTKYNYLGQKDFNTSYLYPDSYVYLTTSYEGQDIPPGPNNPQGQVQTEFKYFLDIPPTQPIGTYIGQIEYSMIDVAFPAITDTITVNVSIEVTAVFELKIDRSTIDFEEMLPGHEKANIPVEGIIATVKTSTGNPWYLKISNDTPLTSGPNIIPNKYFKWYGWSDGTGRWNGTGENSLSLMPELAYSSGAGEGTNTPDGTNNHFKFKLKIPPRQKSGKYISRVRLTLTE